MNEAQAHYIANATASGLRRDLADPRLRAAEPELAAAAAAELVKRGEPLEEPTRPAQTPAAEGFHLRPSETIDGRSAIDVWRGDQLAATIYAGRAGLHIVCSEDYEPGSIAVDVQRPRGVQIDLLTDDEAATEAGRRAYRDAVSR